MRETSEKFTIEEPSLAGIRELIGLCGFSSGGKTRTALILARGIVGPQGRIVVIDTENKRASMFKNLPPGPACPGVYKVINLDAPFSPSRYQGALMAAEKEADIVVVDSMTHEWVGEGGVDDMHEQALDRMTQGSTDWKTRERLNWPAWKQPKQEHKALLRYILRYPLPIICCFRAKKLTKMVKQKDERGIEKNTVVTEAYPVPEFDPGFIYEFLLSAEVYRDVDENKSGLLRLIKITREEILTCLPKQGEQATVEHGTKLVAWCKAQNAGGVVDDKKKLLGELRDVTVSVHGWERSQGAAGWEACKVKLQSWLTDELGIDTLLTAQTEEQLRDTLSKARGKLGL